MGESKVRSSKGILCKGLDGQHRDFGIWTEGRYVTLPNLYLEVCHLRIRESDLEKWKEYLRKHAISFKLKRGENSQMSQIDSPAA